MHWTGKKGAIESAWFHIKHSIHFRGTQNSDIIYLHRVMLSLYGRQSLCGFHTNCLLLMCRWLPGDFISVLWAIITGSVPEHLQLWADHGLPGYQSCYIHLVDRDWRTRGNFHNKITGVFCGPHLLVITVNIKMRIIKPKTRVNHKNLPSG